MASGMSRRIKDALVTVLASIQYNGEPAFDSVLDNTKGEFDGFPSVRVLPGDQTTEKASVAENDRTVSYVVRVHIPLENSGQAESTTYNRMYDLTDLILNTLDQGDRDDALHAVDNTLQTLILNATRGDWMVAETNSAAVLMCDVNVQVRYSKQLA